MSHILNHGSVGYGDPRLIDPWDAIQTNLIQELDADPVTLHQVCQASVRRLGRVNMSNIQTAEDYFNTLRNNLASEEDVVDFLISLMDFIQFHTEMGTQRYADILIQHKKTLAHYKIERARRGIYEGDKDFVGREEDIRTIEEALTEPRRQYKGVCICGLGGLGKTSLAREVCFRITQRKEQWKIFQIDLREKDSLLDLIRDTIVELGQMCSSEDVDSLTKELMECIRTKISQRTIFFFDNLDDLMKNNRGKKELLEFLQTLILELDSLPHRDIRVLLTVRQKLIPEKNLERALLTMNKWEKRLADGIVMETELKPLKEKYAVELLEKCISGPNIREPDGEVCERIVKSCGYSPLAIRSVAATIKSGFTSPELIAENLRSGTSIPSFSEVSKCFNSTFETLEDDKKKVLVKLSVFHTAKFDAAGAASVLGEPSPDKDNPITILTRMDMLYLKSRHLVEIDDSSRRQNSEIKVLSSQSLQYSIHPLVYEFLKFKIKENREFEDVLHDAQIRFVDYFERKISRIASGYDRNCMASQRIFKDNRVHVQNFYDIILKVKSGERKIPKGRERLLSVKHMHDLADLIVDDFQKFELLEKWIKDAALGERYLEVAYWKIFEALKFFETDRNEIALKKLTDVWNNVFPKVLAENLEWCPVLGQFHYLRGRIYLKEGEFDKALADLEQAEDNLTSHREVRHERRLELANVYNTMGCVYYRKPKPDLGRSRQYHELAFRNAIRVVENFNNIELPCFVNNIGACYYKEGLNLEDEGNKGEAREKYENAVRYYDFAMTLDKQFGMHKFDGFAQKLRCKAEAFARLGRTEEAEKYIDQAMELRRANLTPPHDFITVTNHKVGDIKRYAGMKLYKEGKKLKALNKFYEAISAYETTMHLMKCGGLPRDHEEYQRIKVNHLWLLRQTCEKDKLPEAVQFYQDFENGKYEKIRGKRRTEKETTKRFLTHSQLQALAASGQLFQAGNRPQNAQADSSSDSDSEDETTEELQRAQTKETVKAYVKDVLEAEKTVLNFNQILHEVGDEGNSDLEGEEDYLDEYVQDRDTPSSPLISQSSSIDSLVKQAKDEEKMEVEEEDTGQPMGPQELISILHHKANMEEKGIQRRLSEMSVSSQDSVESSVEDKRKAFRNKSRSSGASRDSITQAFLEDLEKTSKVSSKRLRSQGSSSMESSIDEDLVTENQPSRRTFQQMRKLARQHSIQEDSELFNPKVPDEVTEAVEEVLGGGGPKKEAAGMRRKREVSEDIPTKQTRPL